MTVFNASSYGPQFSSLIDAERLCELGPGRSNNALADQLGDLRIESAFAPHRVVDRDMASCCLSGLWLWHDFLDRSHSISQEIGTISGSFWHGIMHRREPDYSNSKYWFRRVGDHPIFDSLTVAARDLAASEGASGPAEYLAMQAHWDAFRFVDLCEAAARGDADCEMLCRRIARSEWQLLFEFCFRAAIEG